MDRQHYISRCFAKSRRLHKKGQVEITFLTVLELALAVMILLLLMNAQKSTVDIPRIQERYAALDAGYLIDAFYAVDHDLTYMYPDNLPYRNVTVIDNVLYVHGDDLSARALQSGYVTSVQRFSRSSSLTFDRYSSADAGLFSFTKTGDRLILQEGTESLRSAQDLRYEVREQSLPATLAFAASTHSAQDLSTKDTLDAFAIFLSSRLSEISHAAPTRTITMQFAFGDVAQILYTQTDAAYAKVVAELAASSFASVMTVTPQSSSDLGDSITVMVIFPKDSEQYVSDYTVILTDALIANLRGALHE